MGRCGAGAPLGPVLRRTGRRPESVRRLRWGSSRGTPGVAARPPPLVLRASAAPAFLRLWRGRRRWALPRQPWLRELLPLLPSRTTPGPRSGQWRCLFPAAPVWNCGAPALPAAAGWPGPHSPGLCLAPLPAARTLLSSCPLRTLIAVLSSGVTPVCSPPSDREGDCLGGGIACSAVMRGLGCSVNWHLCSFGHSITPAMQKCSLSREEAPAALLRRLHAFSEGEESSRDAGKPSDLSSRVQACAQLLLAASVFREPGLRGS